MENDALDPSEILIRRFTVPLEESRAMTPSQRMERFYRLQEEWWAALCADPLAYDAFIRRNFKKRAIDWTPPAEEQKKTLA